MTRYFYAVGRGRQTGVFNSWPDCLKQVDNIANAKYRKFATEAEAWKFVEECKQLSPCKPSTSAVTNLQSQDRTPPRPFIFASTSSFNGTEETNSRRDHANTNNNANILQCLLSDAEKKIKELSNFITSLKSASSGKRSCPLCGSAKKDDDVEEVPLPPKKILKVEIESDDETDRSQYDFDYDQEGFVIVYTDGACENNGRKNAKAGLGVWFKDGHPLNLSEPLVGRATNNNAEIQAVIQALELAKKSGVRKVNVHTDSEFLINCMTKWITKWKSNGWNTSSGNPVKNRTELMLLDQVMTGMEVRFTHVRGHAGVVGNEMADFLARKGAERYNSVHG